MRKIERVIDRIKRKKERERERFTDRIKRERGKEIEGGSFP